MNTSPKLEKLKVPAFWLFDVSGAKLQMEGPCASPPHGPFYFVVPQMFFVFVNFECSLKVNVEDSSRAVRGLPKLCSLIALPILSRILMKDDIGLVLILLYQSLATYAFACDF